ncbi:J-domain from the Dnaj-like protein, partial [Ochromonadaceae sp. CCMP2298]
MSSNFGRQSPYDLLKVDKSATDKEIKLAYFREAKKYHPDLNPNDPTAKAKFQRVAAAYEILSDPGRRRTYDFTGSTADSGSAEGQ